MLTYQENQQRRARKRRAQIKALYARGWSFAQIGQKLGISRQRVCVLYHQQ